MFSYIHIHCQSTASGHSGKKAVSAEELSSKSDWTQVHQHLPAQGKLDLIPNEERAGTTREQDQQNLCRSRNRDQCRVTFSLIDYEAASWTRQ